MIFLDGRKIRIVKEKDKHSTTLYIYAIDLNLKIDFWTRVFFIHFIFYERNIH